VKWLIIASECDHKEQMYHLRMIVFLDLSGWQVLKLIGSLDREEKNLE